jgi:acetoin utilization deacetylase AcuC-like enzyme
MGELAYDFGPEHPMKPRRIVALMDLLITSKLWAPDDELTRLPIRAASLEELKLIHTEDYITEVQRLSTPEEIEAFQIELSSEMPPVSVRQRAEQYGFGEGDTPPIQGMHGVASLIAGGTLVALSAVMGLPEGGTFGSEDERPLHVFHPTGGLHHALPDRASGFCVYNDVSVAIARLLEAREAKVLYIDFDAHHGDGVQHSFYDDPRVLTISLHESGHYLFPGTGDVLEVGDGLGRGYSANVPLEPFTEDDSYIEVMNALVTPLVISFAPDVIISNHGCDTHSWDPLTHFEMTLRGMQAQMRLAHQLAHSYCDGRWLAVGGGGYDVYRVVPRAWSMLWAEVSHQTLPEYLPEEWIERWRPAWLAEAELEEEEEQALGKAPGAEIFPTTFLDRKEDFPAQPRRLNITHTNRRTVAFVRHLLLPSAVRRAFPSTGPLSPMAGIFDLLHLRGSQTPSRSKTIQTRAGPLLMRDFCPPSLVERLVPDSGLHAFAHIPEREHELLLNIAKSPDCALALVHTPEGEIVAQVTLAPGDDWWDGFENVYEVTIEVSSNWRSMGIAETILDFALELDALEDMILFAMGLSWHWDTEELEISVYQYRKLIARLFEAQGFNEYSTTEPNIRMEPDNILLVRIGTNVDQLVVKRFLNRLQSTPHFARW